MNDTQALRRALRSPSSNLETFRDDVHNSLGPKSASGLSYCQLVELKLKRPDLYDMAMNQPEVFRLVYGSSNRD